MRRILMELLPPLFLGLLGFIYFAETINFGFATGEEYWFGQRFGMGDIFDMFTKATWPAYGEYYRPIFQVSYAIDNWLWGYKQAGYHVDTLLIFATFLFVLFNFIKYITASTTVSFIATLLFIVYPTHIFQAAIMSHRVDVVPAIFILSTLIFFIRYIYKGRLMYLAGGTTLAAAALLSKENSLTLPVLLFICLLYLGTLKNFSGRVVSSLVVVSVVTAGYLLLRFILLKDILGPLPVVTSWGAHLYFAFVLNFGKTFLNPEIFGYFNINQISVLLVNIILIYSFIYYHALKPWKKAAVKVLCSLTALLFALVGVGFYFRGSFYLWFLVILIIPVVAAWYKYRHNISLSRTEKTGLFALVWIYVTNLIMFHLSRDRLLFLPSIGYCLFIAAIVCDRFPKGWKGKKDQLVVLAAVLVLVINYVTIGKFWESYVASPSSSYSQLAKLSWFPAALKGEIWQGRRIDQFRKDEYINDLKDKGLINDKLMVTNRALIQMKDAYWIYNVNDFAYKIFASPRISPDSDIKGVEEKFIRYGLGVE